MTHEVPWYNIHNTTHVIIKLSKGEMPPRPQDPAVITRGLDDNLWWLTQRCWSTTAEERPSTKEIQELLTLFG